MNKIKFLLLSIALLFSVTCICVADDINYTFSSVAKFPTTIEPTIHHTDIKNISSINRDFNAKFSVLFGSYSNAKAKINYREDSSEIKTTHEVSISNDKEFFIDISVGKTATKFEYQLEVSFEDGSGKTVYYPTDKPYVITQIASSVEDTFTPSATGTITLETGNQEYGNTSLVVPSGSLASTTKITIEQLDMASLTSGILKVSPSTAMVALYSVTADPEVEILPPGITTNLSYGTTTTATKFDLFYRHTSSDEWEPVTITNTDNKLKLVTANIMKFGQYAIFVAKNLSDNDYRPKRRTIVKSRIGTNYPGFEFKYLKDGDTLNIFNLTGKKIRSIHKKSSSYSEGFLWDGRNDSGDWAKSGIYIYQIKVDGKTISGTIVFVK